MDVLGKIGGKDKLGLIQEKEDAELKAILLLWPTRFDKLTGVLAGIQAGWIV